MRDPHEGVSASGIIVTGADRSRVPRNFEELLHDAVARFKERGNSVDVYVYGSVATGTAVTGLSDVDLLTIGASSTDGEDIATAMSLSYVAQCRGVEVAVAQRDDSDGDTDEAYGNRVGSSACMTRHGPPTETAQPCGGRTFTPIWRRTWPR